MSGQEHKGHWLVSIGDLVTLLVCLFVAMLSIQGSKPGRALAEDGAEQVLELGLDDFNESGTELTENGATTLKQLIISSGSRLAVRSCSGAFDVTHLARTLAVARQFPVTPLRGEVGFSGADCEMGSVLKVGIGR